MLRNLCRAILPVFFILLLAGCDSGPRIGPLEHNAVVLAFGDSLTYGTGAPDGQSYPEILSALLGRPVVNAGVPGEVSAAGLRRLASVLDQHQPRLVVLCHGGNDFLRRLDQEATSHNLRMMIELIRGRGADVVLVGVPKLGFGLEVPKFYPALAKAYALPFEDRILLELLGDNRLKSDTIHPNAAGYRLMAEAIHRAIKRAERK